MQEHYYKNLKKRENPGGTRVIVGFGVHSEIKVITKQCFNKVLAHWKYRQWESSLYSVICKFVLTAIDLSLCCEAVDE